MQEELGLTKIQMGYAFAAFGWAYALFEIPGGWLGDRIGPRKVLMRVVSMWSIFTIATGWAWNLVSLVIFRFFFGMGEAGCFPNITKAFTTWFPVAERVKAQGVLWLSARWGGAFTPLLVGWMLASGGEGRAGLGLHYPSPPWPCPSCLPPRTTTGPSTWPSSPSATSSAPSAGPL